MIFFPRWYNLRLNCPKQIFFRFIRLCWFFQFSFWGGIFFSLPIGLLALC